MRLDQGHDIRSAARIARRGNDAARLVQHQVHTIAFPDGAALARVDDVAVELDEVAATDDQAWE